MAFDATFWVAVSFVIFFGALIYLKVPQNVNNLLKIFNFHPLHIYFNFHNIEQYENFKIKNGYDFSDKSNVDAFINRNNNGVQTFFRDLVSSLSDKQSYTIQELKDNFFE